MKKNNQDEKIIKAQDGVTITPENIESPNLTQEEGGTPEIPEGEQPAAQNLNEPSTVDFFGLRFFQQNDEAINQMQFRDPNMELTLLPLEEAFEKYKARIQDLKVNFFFALLFLGLYSLAFLAVTYHPLV